MPATGAFPNLDATAPIMPATGAFPDLDATAPIMHATGAFPDLDATAPIVPATGAFPNLDATAPIMPATGAFPNFDATIETALPVIEPLDKKYIFTSFTNLYSKNPRQNQDSPDILKAKNGKNEIFIYKKFLPLDPIVGRKPDFNDKFSLGRFHKVESTGNSTTTQHSENTLIFLNRGYNCRVYHFSDGIPGTRNQDKHTIQVEVERTNNKKVTKENLKCINWFSISESLMTDVLDPPRKKYNKKNL